MSGVQYPGAAVLGPHTTGGRRDAISRGNGEQAFVPVGGRSRRVLQPQVYLQGPHHQAPVRAGCYKGLAAGSAPHPHPGAPSCVGEKFRVPIRMWYIGPGTYSYVSQHFRVPRDSRSCPSVLLLLSCPVLLPSVPLKTFVLMQNLCTHPFCMPPDSGWSISQKVQLDTLTSLYVRGAFDRKPGARFVLVTVYVRWARSTLRVRCKEPRVVPPYARAHE